MPLDVACYIGFASNTEAAKCNMIFTEGSIEILKNRFDRNSGKGNTVWEKTDIN